MPLLVLLFIVVPLLELWVIIEVGGLIGIAPTIGLLLATSLAGAALLRAQGRSAWRRFNEALAEGRMPHREVFDGALVLLGGALLLTPGFITDGVGLALLIPPTRAGIRSLLSRLVVGRIAVGGRAASWGYGRYRERRGRQAQGAPGRPPAGRHYDYEGSAREVGEDPQLRRPPSPKPTEGEGGR